MSRKVTYARLQTEAYVTGAGSLGNVFPSQNKTLESLSMSTQVEGLNISFIYRGLKKELLIPYANVIIMELAPVEESKKPTAVKAAA